MFRPTYKLLIALLAGCALSAASWHHVSAEDSDDPYIEIGLRCPTAEGGTLELLQGNKQGKRDRITIVYDGDRAVRLEAAVGARGAGFETYFSSDSPEDETDAANKEFSDTLLAKFGMLRRGVCLAPKAERDRYFLMLDRQKSDR